MARFGPACSAAFAATALSLSGAEALSILSTSQTVLSGSAVWFEGRIPNQAMMRAAQNRRDPRKRPQSRIARANTGAGNAATLTTWICRAREAYARPYETHDSQKRWPERRPLARVSSLLGER